MPKLFVGNLPHASSNLELRYWVESRGFRVESVEIIVDRETGRSRGFGFVTIGETVNIHTAISMLNGQRMDGRILTVNEATPLFARSEHFSADGQPMPPKDPT
jgi:cold-inducible RNA-binding protein